MQHGGSRRLAVQEGMRRFEEKVPSNKGCYNATMLWIDHSYRCEEALIPACVYHPTRKRGALAL